LATQLAVLKCHSFASKNRDIIHFKIMIMAVIFKLPVYFD
jgi:hypothetical protein